MARIITDDMEKEVEDGSALLEPCEELGIPFGCQNGLCGTCMIDIVEGEDNLNELNEKEIDMRMTKKRRLACQCKIKSGDVQIRF